MKYINLTFFILSLAFFAILSYHSQQYFYYDNTLDDLASAINQDFKSALTGDSISQHPQYPFDFENANPADRFVNLNHQFIVENNNRINVLVQNDESFVPSYSYEDMTEKINLKWDSTVGTIQGENYFKNNERRNYYIFSTIFIIVLSLLALVNFIIQLVDAKKNRNNRITTTPVIKSSYYYLLSDKQNGPVSHDEIIKQIKQNIILHSTLLWKDGMADWVEASSIDEFKENFN